MRRLVASIVLASTLAGASAHAQPKLTKPPRVVELADAPNPEKRAAEVVLRIRIDAEGRVTDATVLQSAGPTFDASAIEALKASRFEPAEIDGKPAAIVSQIPMPFGGIWANQSLRKSFTITGTPTVERELAIGKVDEKIEDGRLAEDQARADLTALMAELNELVAVIADERLQQLAAARSEAALAVLKEAKAPVERIKLGAPEKLASSEHEVALKLGLDKAAR